MGSRDFLFSSDLPPHSTEVPIKTDHEDHKNRLCSVNSPSTHGPLGSAQEHAFWRIPLATFVRTSASVSLGNLCLLPNLSLCSNMSVCPFSLWHFPSVRPLACFSPGSLAEHTNLSLRRHWSVQFSLIQETQPLGLQLSCVLFLNRTSLYETS